MLAHISRDRGRRLLITALVATTAAATTTITLTTVDSANARPSMDDCTTAPLVCDRDQIQTP